MTYKIIKLNTIRISNKYVGTYKINTQFLQVIIKIFVFFMNFK